MQTNRFALGLALAAVFLAAAALPAAEKPERATDDEGNLLIAAVAWKQTAAEYRALYYQGFNIARLHLDNALCDRRPGDKPLAVITDVDDTILSAVNFWGHLVGTGKDFFDDDIWDKWVEADRFEAMPGALDFFKYAADNGVEVFYVTNRDQGENTYALATRNLQTHGFPFVDEKHLIVQRDTSNKETPQQAIAEEYQVVVMLGDNLNDFARKYYVKDVDERLALMEEDRALYGTKYIVFPNPTDGHWMRAIFGDSEPPPSEDNRRTFKAAATRSAW
ncbi:MAG: 5'-nucleotidase, lipoprotein e(P4) family [Planctomycetaceae bacterium]|nr:5'-nucleotidase, lipoprotein e(P4) family [Planctomycetaceae bacterium]